MGTARVEIFRMQTRRDSFPGQVGELLQVANETTSTTATTAGSRITVTGSSAYDRLHARIVHDEAAYVMIGADPTATSTALAYKLAPNVPLVVPVNAGDKFSFIEVA